MKKSEVVSEILRRIPSVPGVYLMKNKKGDIIYVWKSVNLKSRVNSYFSDSSSLNFAKKIMVGQIEDIDYIETKNEVEALILETNLIKKNRPKYNILMKDDKNLSYIKITKEAIPEVFRTRIRNEWDGTYFGPYSSSTNVADILKSLKRLFHIRSCKMRFGEIDGKLTVIYKAGRSIPCIDHYIGICPAPCTLESTKLQAYSENIERLKKFLKWDTGTVLEELREKMRAKARELAFEEAGEIKAQIENIESIVNKQVARDIIKGNNDVLVYMEKYEKIFVGITEVRNGEIVGMHQFLLEDPLQEGKDVVLPHFLTEYYLRTEEEEQIIGKIHLLTNEEIKDETLLQVLKDKCIEIELPQIGPKVEIINFTKNNLLNFAYKKELNDIGKKSLSRGTQSRILERLWYPVPEWELVFECYDISHTAGNFTVASRSVIVNGKSENGRYRKYKLKNIETGEIDDFKSMTEIMSRRALEAIKENNWPSLLIIDGGKWQLSSAIYGLNKGIEAYKLEHPEESEKIIPLPPIASLAKREEEIFVPDKSESILFKKWESELMLLQKIRDEAHRFAITFNRQSRSKAMKKNILEELPGFGPTSRKKLLKLAGSVDDIKNLSEEELKTVLNSTQIETLRDHGLL